MESWSFACLARFARWTKKKGETAGSLRSVRKMAFPVHLSYILRETWNNVIEDARSWRFLKRPWNETNRTKNEAGKC